MFGYWILIGIPIFLSFMSSAGKKLDSSLFWVGVFYILFIGLRYEVGADRWAYEDMYFSIASYSSLRDALEITEPSFVIINWVLGQFNAGVYWVNFVVSIIFVTGLVRFAKTTPLPFIALIAVTPYLVIAIGMSATRQSAAIGLVFHLMASWRQNLPFKFTLSALATSFHTSGIMSAVFVLQSIKMPMWLRLLVYAGGGAIMYPILSATESAQKYQKTYLEDNIVSSGALMHALLNGIPALIYLVFWRQWHNRFGRNDLLPMLAVLSILSVFSVSISSTGVDRLALYLSPIQMIVYGSLPYLFGATYKTQLSVFVIIIHIIIQYLWLAYANTAEPFLPYQNLIITSWF